MDGDIINKVSESGLLSLDLEKYYPREPVEIFDLKDYLFMGSILKEKDFRDALKTQDWGRFTGKRVGVTCSADAIIPPWAYMLIAAYLEPLAISVTMGNQYDVRREAFLKNLAAIDLAAFNDQRIVVKGCGDTPIDDFAYMEIARLLRPVAKTIMYGEPCSTVPVFKKK
jgi:Protein of unknown function (DUF2480)